MAQLSHLWIDKFHMVAHYMFLTKIIYLFLFFFKFIM